MHLKGAHFWRVLTMAAVLLFSAAQLVEQSHFHDNVDSLCAVCTHADGQDALVAATSEQSSESFGYVRPVQQVPATPHTQLPHQYQSRAPPYFLS